MKKTVTIVGAVLLVAAVAIPAMAWWGPGWGGMHRGMGWGHGPMYGWNSGYGYGTLDKEQATKLDQLRQEFFKDTTDLRKDLWNKSRELGSVLNAENPDRDKAEALQSEIGELRNKLAKKRLNFQLEARKIVPNSGDRAEGYGPGYGRGMMGYGRGMMGQGGYGPGYGMGGYGHGPGMMGYGQHMGGFGGGACWN